MIKYRLRCACTHEFEAWFRSSATYEVQAQDQQICCPACGGHDVDKAIMAPNLAGRGCSEEGSGQSACKQERLCEVLREIRSALVAGAEDVGARFPDEARKIHYGETEPRGIHGTASGEEARSLLEEGIEILAFPPLPEDAN